MNSALRKSIRRLDPPLSAPSGGSARLPAAALAMLAALLLVAGAAAQAPGANAESSVAVVQHSAAVSGYNSLIAFVDVRLSAPAQALIEYENDEAGRFRTPLAAATTVHRIPVVRLRAETTYRYAVGIDAGGGGIVFPPNGSGEFTSGELPERLAGLENRVFGRSTQPLILSDLQSWILYQDDAGRIVWYYEPPEGTRGVGAITRSEDGNLLWESQRCCLHEITALGQPIAEFMHDDEGVRPHHDYLRLADGRIMSLAERDITIDDSANAGDAATPVTLDTIIRWDPASGRTERVWDALDFWDLELPGERVVWEQAAWAGRRFRWTHGNSLSFGPDGDLIVSFRNRRQVVSISPDFSSIEWELGGPGSDYEFPNPADRFYGQHTAAELPNGNILIFDNGLRRPEEEGGRYSRALELRLDERARTAVKVWEYRLDPDFYAPQFGSAYRLRNGNTLVNFPIPPAIWGDAADADDTTIVLVEADAAGEEVFRLDLSAAAPPQRYRAYGDIDSIMGETRLPSAKELRAGLSSIGPDQLAAWRAGFSTMASELLAALAEEGVRSLWLRTGSAWQRYAIAADGRGIPGSADFKLMPGGAVWLGS